MTKTILKQDETSIKINPYPTDTSLDYHDAIQELPGYRSTLSYMKHKFIEGQLFFTREELWENAKWLSDENAFESQLKIYELDGCITKIGDEYHITDKEFNPLICKRFASDK